MSTHPQQYQKHEKIKLELGAKGPDNFRYLRVKRYLNDPTSFDIVDPQNNLGVTLSKTLSWFTTSEYKQQVTTSKVQRTTSSKCDVWLEAEKKLNC